MAADSRAVPLEDLVDDILDRRGVTPTKLGAEFTDAGHRVISAKLMKQGRVDLAADEPRFVDAATYEKWMRSPLRADDVLLTSEAPLGEVAYLTRDVDWVLGQRLFCIRTNKRRLHGRFLYYALRSEGVMADLHGRATGTTVTGVRQSELRRVAIPVPPLAEQHAIGTVLGALDDKIDLNRRLNRTLEELAQAIFKSWFIDFDGHDDLVDSEIGPVPRGWHYRRAADVADVGIGKTPPRKEPHWFSEAPTDVKWMSIKDLGACGTYIFETSERLTHAAVAGHRVRVIPDNTVVLSFKLTVGRVAITDGDMCSNEAIAHFRLPRSSPLSPEFLLCYLRSFQYGELGSTSSIATAVNSKIIQDMPLLVPPRDVVARFDGAVRALFRRLKAVAHESRTLAALRDTLLPKLISGELRVPDAEATVSEAL